MPRLFVSALLGLILGCSAAFAQDSLDDLADLESGFLDKPSTACSILSLATKAVVASPEFVETNGKRIEEEIALTREVADIFFAAQQESGVSIDDVDPKDLGAALVAILREYDESRAAELAAAADVPKEEWSSFDYARTALSVASIADPTGVVGVAAAYTYPKCGSKEAETGVGGFCWRDSHTRGVGWIPDDLGRVADCPPGMTNMGLTCQSWGDTVWRGRVADCPKGYTNNGLTCGRSGDTISAPSRLANCPRGFTNNGLFCGRGGDSYWKGCTTIFKKFPCKSGYTDMGCHCQRWPETRGPSSMTCPAGYFKGVAQRCFKNCPSGYTNTGEFCTKPPSTLGIKKMTCASGEKKVGARCYRTCPEGYTNTGEFCQIWPETKGISAMSCKSGEFKSGARCYDNDACKYTENGRTKFGEMDAGLCYDTCRKNFYGVGPVCWSSCTGKLKTECAAGCASSGLECGLATTDMVASPFEVVVSVVSLSGYSSAKAARKTAMMTARQAAKEAAAEGAKRAATRAGRELAKDAAKKLARESVDALDDELFEALIRYGDDVADGIGDNRQSARKFLDELDDIERQVDDVLADVGDDLADDLADLDDLIADLDDLIKQLDDDVADLADQPALKRLANGFMQGTKRGWQETAAMRKFVGDNASRFTQMIKKNAYEPVKKAKNYVPNKLRSKSEMFDYFMQNKSRIGAKPYVTGPRMARNCGKFGIVIAKEVTGE